MSAADPSFRSTLVCVPDLRDYERINAELIQRLDEGFRHVRLVGAEGQRFLAAGLAGAWDAEVEVEGRAGPELAAGLNAPGVTVVCRGPAADGAGRALRAGRLVIVGDAGEAVGYAMEGGTLLVARSVGARAGLNQRGGTLMILGAVGRLAAERQAGGRFLAFRDHLGPHAGRGRRGGRLVLFDPGGQAAGDLEPGDLDDFEELRRALESWTKSAAAGPDAAGAC